VAQIVAWLADKAEQIEGTKKGKIEVNFAGSSLVISNLQITECGRRGKR